MDRSNLFEQLIVSGMAQMYGVCVCVCIGVHALNINGLNLIGGSTIPTVFTRSHGVLSSLNN